MYNTAVEATCCLKKSVDVQRVCSPLTAIVQKAKAPQTNGGLAWQLSSKSPIASLHVFPPVAGPRAGRRTKAAAPCSTHRVRASLEVDILDADAPKSRSNLKLKGTRVRGSTQLSRMTRSTGRTLVVPFPRFLSWLVPHQPRGAADHFHTPHQQYQP